MYPQTFQQCIPKPSPTRVQNVPPNVSPNVSPNLFCVDYRITNRGSRTGSLVEYFSGNLLPPADEAVLGTLCRPQLSPAAGRSLRFLISVDCLIMAVLVTTVPPPDSPA